MKVLFKFLWVKTLIWESQKPYFRYGYGFEIETFVFLFWKIFKHLNLNLFVETNLLSKSMWLDLFSIQPLIGFLKICLVTHFNRFLANLFEFLVILSDSSYFWLSCGNSFLTWWILVTRAWLWWFLVIHSYFWLSCGSSFLAQRFLVTHSLSFLCCDNSSYFWIILVISF